jgi:AbrB family looped-hinge helix DNA binding protein
MAKAEDETTVNESYSVTVPATIRRMLGVEPGDKIRWRVTEDDDLVVELVEQRKRALSDLDPVDFGEPTHAAEDHDEIAAHDT